jgi:hypothetical protein
MNGGAAMQKSRRISACEAGALAEDPLSFAMLMTDEELEKVVSEFVEVMNRRREYGRWSR